MGVRVRLFREGEYVETKMFDAPDVRPRDVLMDMRPKNGDILYWMDFYQEVQGSFPEQKLMTLRHDNPKVRGLWSQAVAAERAH